MKKTLFSCAIMLFVSTLLASNPVGVWKSVDDETGKEKSHIKIFEKNGLLYGNIEKLLMAEDQGKNCDKCEGEKHDKPVLGLQIMWAVSAAKDSKGQYGGGKILDPKNGKVYSCYLQLISETEMKVRGYIGGMKALGRSQTWYRIK